MGRPTNECPACCKSQQGKAQPHREKKKLHRGQQWRRLQLMADGFTSNVKIQVNESANAFFEQMLHTRACSAVFGQAAAAAAAGRALLYVYCLRSGATSTTPSPLLRVRAPASMAAQCVSIVASGGVHAGRRQVRSYFRGADPRWHRKFGGQSPKMYTSNGFCWGGY